MTKDRDDLTSADQMMPPSMAQINIDLWETKHAYPCNLFVHPRFVIKLAIFRTSVSVNRCVAPPPICDMQFRSLSKLLIYWSPPIPRRHHASDDIT